MGPWDIPSPADMIGLMKSIGKMGDQIEKFASNVKEFKTDAQTTIQLLQAYLPIVKALVVEMSKMNANLSQVAVIRGSIDTLNVNLTKATDVSVSLKTVASMKEELEKLNTNIAEFSKNVGPAIKVLEGLG